MKKTFTPSPTRTLPSKRLSIVCERGLGWGAVLRLFNCRVIKGVLSFRIYFGIARLKSVITALATLNQVQGDEKL